MTVGGAARHNVANALAAAAAARVLEVPPDASRATLRRFGRAASDNAGRANWSSWAVYCSSSTTPTIRTGWRRWRR